jgi:mannitol 2-dehydrogenase
MDRPRLSRSTLPKLTPPRGRLAYDPARLRAGIVHLGLGNFHRAHMARYTHALIELDPLAAEWGIIGVGLLAADRTLHDALAPQDWLYSLVERDGDSERVEVIASLSGMMLVDGDSGALLDTMDDAAIRIVSLTITEKGYSLIPGTKRLDKDHPAITADLRSPEMPRSAIGIIVAALRRRRAAGKAAFTVMSCDNIQHNGDVLKRAVLDYAEDVDPALSKWIAVHASFPNTMVDRITPATRQEDIAAVAERMGIDDAAPVFCEPFTQWVIEDKFAVGRPAWEHVGAQFVADVTPYEKMKLRLLNASHLALAAIGQSMGYTYVDEAMRDPALARYLAALMDCEAGTTLDPVPGIDIEAYKTEIVGRFGNPTIHDTLARIISDAPIDYLLDPIADRLRQGEAIEMLALAVAAWLWTGRSDKYVDPKLFGDLGHRAEFTAPVEAWLAHIDRHPAPGWASLLNQATAAFDRHLYAGAQTSSCASPMSNPSGPRI